MKKIISVLAICLLTAGTSIAEAPLILKVRVERVSLDELESSIQRYVIDALNTLDGIQVVKKNPEYVIHVNAHPIKKKDSSKATAVACSLLVTKEEEKLFSKIMNDNIGPEVISAPEIEDKCYKLVKILDNLMFISSSGNLDKKCKKAVSEINSHVFEHERYVRRLIWQSR